MRVPIKPSEMTQGMRVFWKSWSGADEQECIVLNKHDWYLWQDCCSRADAVVCRLSDGELYTVRELASGESFTVECPDCYLCS